MVAAEHVNIVTVNVKTIPNTVLHSIPLKQETHTSIFNMQWMSDLRDWTLMFKNLLQQWFLDTGLDHFYFTVIIIIIYINLFTVASYRKSGSQLPFFQLTQTRFLFLAGAGFRLN